MNKVNEQKNLEKVLLELEREGKRPHLLLHSCCAPCSSYCLEYLTGHFRITDYFYNPNITERAEYDKRAEELKRLIKELPHDNEITFLDGGYEEKLFFEKTRGFEDCPERGDRCRICFALRLEKAAEKAAEIGADYLTTTLTISPLKDAALLNEIGRRAAAKAGVKWLPSDFKKKGGYQRSIELSGQYDLYRQNYCGCVFSKRNMVESRDGSAEASKA